jgi:PAS domain S-box-containing protein
MKTMPDEAGQASSKEGLIAVDHAYCIMSSNSAAERLLGIPLPPGQTFRPEFAFGPEELFRTATAFNEALNPGPSPMEISLPLLTASKTGVRLAIMFQPIYDSPDTVIGVIMTFIPETCQKTSAASSSQEEQDRRVIPGIQNAMLLESLPEGVFTIDNHWRIESFNHRAEEITGYRREEVIGRHCWEIFRSDLCQLGCPLRTALESGISATDQDVRILKKGGKRQTILVNTGVLRTSTGKIIGAVETFRPLAGESYFDDMDSEAKGFAEIIGRSSAMKRVFDMLPDIAASDANVLLVGESGVGKDLIVRTIHERSPRRNKPFIAVNCSALAETLLESELFGHEKAAFTGATDSKLGRFELAKGGTLFLDEIGELKPELQIKLLRVLENREFERVGGSRTLSMEARIISATNKDLRLAIAEGHFREDFYYRLRTVPITVPPLRERVEDIPLLVDFFLKKFNRRFKKRVMSVHPEVMQMFMNYRWPGNVRELERTLEHAYVFVKGPIILPANLPAADEFGLKVNAAEPIADGASSPINRETIQGALSRASSNRKEAARLLGMSRSTLWRRMKQFGLGD